jgi:hypothetical protein
MFFKMTNEKPREFWIIDETPYSTWVSSKPLHSADTKEEIHVIEYSALTALELENARLREALEAYVKYDSQRDYMEENYFEYDGYRHRCYLAARAALGKIEGEG